MTANYPFPDHHPVPGDTTQNATDGPFVADHLGHHDVSGQAPNASTAVLGSQALLNQVGQALGQLQAGQMTSYHGPDDLFNDYLGDDADVEYEAIADDGGDGNDPPNLEPPVQSVFPGDDFMRGAGVVSGVLLLAAAEFLSVAAGWGWLFPGRKNQEEGTREDPPQDPENDPPPDDNPWAPPGGEEE